MWPKQEHTIMANRNNKAAIVPVTSTAPVALDTGLQAIPSTVIAAVRDTVMGELAPMMGAKLAKTQVSDKYKSDNAAADNADVTTRKGIYVRLAGVSLANNYAQKHIDDGVDAAVLAYAESRNSELDKVQQNTLKTFAGECKRVMHPAVREHVEQAYITCEALWAAEGDALKAAAEGETVATPYRDAFKKLDFFVKNANGFLGAYVHKDATVRSLAGNPEALAQHVIATARANPVAAAKRIASVAETLAEICERFPDQGFHTLVAQVAAIDADKLRAFAKVRDAKALATNTLVPTRVAPRAAATPSATPPVTAAAAHAATEDLLDAMEMKKQNGELKAMLAAIVAKLA
jgi:hypothetical protein